MENTAYAFTPADFGFLDPHDHPANNFQTVKVSTLPAAGTLTNNGTAVSAGDFVSISDISSGLLVFTPAANATGTPYDTFSFQVQDDGGTVDGGIDTDPTPRSMTLNVRNSSWVNQAPVGTSNTVTTLQNTVYAFTASDFGFIDPNDSPANSFRAVKITTLPSGGTLTDNGIAINAGQVVSLSHLNSGLLIYAPATNSGGTSYDSFNFKVQDDGGTYNGGLDTDSTARSMTVNVTIVNQAPSGTNKTVTTLEDTAYVLSASDFGFTDANDSPADTFSAVKITSLPYFGTLTKNGGAVSAGEFISVSDINAGYLVFTPGANLSGSGYVGFRFQVQDDGGTVNGGVDTDPSFNLMMFNFTAVNDAPVNTVPAPQTTNEDANLVFSSGNSNPISIGDVDAGSSAVEVALTAAHGKLTLNGTTGLTFSTGDGTSDAVMMFTGTTTNINTALNGLTYVPTANFASGASVRIKTNDLGNSGSGGSQIDDDTVAITVTPDATNDAPVNFVPASQTTNEDTSLVFSAANGNPIIVSDDSGSSSIQVSFSAMFGTVSLNGTAGLTFSFSDANGTGSGDGAADSIMTFRGSLASVNAALSGMSFAPTGNFKGSASFMMTANDLGSTGSGGVKSDMDNVSITVNSVNDAPTGTNNTMMLGEDTNFTFAAVTFGFSDSNDSPANAFLSVKISTLPNNGILKNNGVPVSAGDYISVADLNTGKLVFTPGANANGTGYASFTFQVRDDGGTANGGVDLDQSANSVTFNVSAVNDAPFNTVPSSQTTTKNTALVFSSANGNAISIADIDAGGAVMQVSLSVMNGTLTLSGLAGLTFTMGDGTSDTMMTFTGTITAINTALNGLTYTPPTNYTGSTSLLISTNDLGNTGSGGSLTDFDSVGINVTL